MLRFLAGMATGWVAARSLPPTDTHPFSLPTVDEISTLTLKLKDILTDIQNNIKKKSN